MLTDSDFDTMEGSASRDALDGDGIIIDASNKDLAEVAAMAWRAIIRANQPLRLFQFGDGNEPVLVRMIEGGKGYRVSQTLNDNRLRHELARAAKWIEPAGKTYRASKPSLDVVRDMLASPEFPLLRIRRFARTPFIDADLNLVIAPGYHADSQTYLDLGALNLPSIPAKPSAAELVDAVALLNEMICDFRFAQPSDRAHAFALLLLPVVHPLIDALTPLHNIEGPIAGSGKGLLSAVLTYPTLGHLPPTDGEPQTDTEFNKLLVSLLLAGSTHIFIDNVNRPVASSAWAKAVTSPIFRERILGVNRVIEAPMRLAWVMTANNPTFSNEMARRMIRIRIDPGCVNPEERCNFRHPYLTDWVMSRRAEIIYAMLIIVQSWVSHNCPPASHGRTLGSFERWATIIGGILEHARIDGFLEGRLEAVSIADGETVAWGQLISEWYIRHADHPVPAKDIFPLAKEIPGIYLGRDAKSEHAQLVAFGMGLSKRRDRVFSIGLDDDDRVRQSVKIEPAGTSRRAVQWKLTRLEAA